MVEYMRMLATRRHVSIRSFDVNDATVIFNKAALLFLFSPMIGRVGSSG
ncbi:hypothetical protein Tco_1426134, partial [Tanacetum coccineum]